MKKGEKNIIKTKIDEIKEERNIGGHEFFYPCIPFSIFSLLFLSFFPIFSRLEFSSLHTGVYKCVYVCES